MNPRKMKQMMKQMGIDVEDVDAEEVIIRTEEHDLVFEDAEVTKMDARGQETYQIVGSPEEREKGASGGTGEAAAEIESEAESGGAGEIPDADIEIVSQRTGASEDAAREALEETGGDLAAAVEKLE